jgi:hypothetical protein
VGVTKSTVKSPECIPKGQVPYITVNPNKRNRYSDIELNDFYTALDLKGGDIIMAKRTNPILWTTSTMIGESQNWKKRQILN